MPTPGRLQQIETLYQAALKLAADDREALLAGSDPEVRREVELLLRQEAATETMGDSLDAAAPGQPRRVGPYVIERSLGAGGMGEVFRANDTRLNRAVAIKFCEPRFIARFQREAKAISALNHPNICTLYDVGPNYLVMELIEGQTLAALLRKGPVELAEVVQYGSQIAGALAEAHAAGIIHRDLKPGNVMLSKHGVKVLDFGLAKLTTDFDDGLTRTNAVMGTPAYMSPEQVRGQDADPRADLFALGLMLYVMSTGHLPFPGASLGSMLVKGAVAIPPASAVPKLDGLIRRLLEREPTDRPATAHSIQVELEALVEKPTAPEPSRRLFTGMAVGTAAVAAVGGGVWWITRQGTAGAVKQISSLAVLPLKNLSGDPAQEFFSDGMTEELIGELANIESLRVTSRTSAMLFRNSDLSLPEIAKRLNVDAIVEGSIQRVGNRVRISAQLIDARDDRSLWSGKLERESSDAFRLQSDIASAVATQIRTQLNPAQKARQAKSRALNPEAHDAYLRGVYYSHQGTDGIVRGMSAFESAVAIDPAYAEAHAALGGTHISKAFFGLGSAQDNYPQAKASATRALELDPESSTALNVLAEVKKNYDWDLHGAAELYQRSIDAGGSSNSGIISTFADCLTLLGRMDEAIAWGQKMVALDPLAATIVGVFGMFYYRAERFKEGMTWCERALELDKSSTGAHWFLTLIREQLGDLPQAVAQAKKAVAVSSAPLFRSILGHAYAMAGDRANALRMIDELKAEAVTAYVEPVDIALIYAGLGMRDAAFEWLEKGFAARNGLIHEIRFRHYAKLRPDPRFEGLVKRVGLPWPIIV